jgi:Complex 1 protein (LYR family)
MEKPLSKSLLRLSHFPNYICVQTRSRVLKVYKELIKEANAFIDPLCRQHLRRTFYETFVAYKYVTRPQQVEALVRQAELKRDRLKTANRGDAVITDEIFLDTLRSIGVDEFASHKLHRFSRVNRESIAFRIKHLSIPSIDSYEEEKTRLQGSTELFYGFRRLLRKNNITKGKNDRKLKYDIPSRLTVFGTLASPLRLKNLLSKSYKAFLHDAPTPVDPSVIEYIDKQLKFQHGITDQKRRFYRRRLLQVQKFLFTVEMMESGELRMVVPSKRAAGSNDIYFERMQQRI